MSSCSKKDAHFSPLALCLVRHILKWRCAFRYNCSSWHKLQRANRLKQLVHSYVSGLCFLTLLDPVNIARAPSHALKGHFGGSLSLQLGANFAVSHRALCRAAVFSSTTVPHFWQSTFSFRHTLHFHTLRNSFCFVNLSFSIGA